MAEFYAYKYSTSHLFFPKIIITLLVVLGLVIAVPKLLAALKERKNGGKKYRFFVEGYDKLKLFGTVILMILYVLALDLVGFCPPASCSSCSLTFCSAAPWRKIPCWCPR